MKCLVVGGTGFLGGAIVDALVQQGDDVTILTRGKTRRLLPDSVKTIQANRYGDLSALAEERFDWIFDTCAFAPDAVERLLSVVGEDCQRYVLISSLSVYGDYSKRGLTEADPVPKPTEADFDLAASLSDNERGSAVSYGSSYGPLKRACERTAEQMIGEKATALRVGLLIGAGDYTDRLTWWVRRLDEAVGSRQRVPAPAPSDLLVQMIDVVDVARFARHCGQTELSGIWNVTGTPATFKNVLDTVIQETASEADLVWVSEQSILDTGISPWTDIPLMAPSLPQFRYFLEVSTHKAVETGLVCRPLQETLTGLISWDRDNRDRKLTAGMDEELEARLLN